MPSDVLITPASSKIDFTDGSNATKRLNISGTAFSFNSNLNVLSSTSLSSAFKAEGVNGTLFEVTDDLSNSLMSVNTIGGLPVFEVFANNSIIGGQYGANDFVISGNKIGLGYANPVNKLSVSGSVSIGSSYNVAAPSNGLIVQGDVGIGVTSFAYSNANRANLEMYGSGESLIALRNSTGNSYIQKSGADFYINNITNGFIAISNNGSERWRITNAGVFESNNAQTIRTSTGNLTLATNAGNGHVILSPHGTGNVGVGTATPSQKLEVQGNIKLGADGAGSYIYYVKDNEGTIIRTTRSDVSQEGLLRSDGWGNFTFNKSIGIGYSLGSSFASSAIGNGNLYVLNSIGINTTSPLTKLDVRTGSITSGTAASTSGSTIIAGYYSDTAGVLTVLGTEQASGGPVLGYAVTPSTSATGAFLSSTTITIPRSAYTQDGGTHRWYIGASQTVAIGGAVTTSEVMRINSSGNLGVGITSPTQKLSVADTLSITNTAGIQYLLMGNQDSSGANNPAIIQSANGAFSFGGGTSWSGSGGTFTSTMFLSDAGNVGIGTTSPSNRLDSAINIASSDYLGDANVYALAIKNYDATAGNAVGMTFGHGGYSYTNFVASIRTGTGANPKGDLVFGGRPADGSAFTENMRLKAGGNVGIGTANPGTSLEIYATPATSTTLRQMLIINTDFASASGTGFGGSIVFRGRTAGNLLRDNAQITAYNEDIGDNGYALGFFTRPSDGGGLQQRLTILRGGNVGIATLSPANKLAVLGSVSIGSGYNTAAPTNGLIVEGSIGAGTTSPDLKVHIDAANAYPASSGTTPNGYLTLRAKTAGGTHGMYMGVANASPYGSWIQCSDSTNLATNYPLLLNPNGGSVGIGLTNPSYKLDVGAVGSGSISVRLTPGYERVRYYGFDLLGYNDGNLWMMGNNPTNTLLLSNSWDWDYQIAISYTPSTIGAAGGSLEIGQMTKNNANFTHGNTRFYTNGIERLRIINNGNVGIGISSPAARLHVNSTTSGATLLRADGTSGTLFSVVDDLSDSLMSVNNSAGLPVLEVFADDRVVAGQYGANDFVLVNNKIGIGTNNPQYELDIVGPGTNAAVNIITRIRSSASSDTFNTGSVIAFTNTTTNVNAYSYIGSRIDLGSAGDNAQALIFATNATNTLPTEKMRIKSDGNVGIGTLSPTAKLESYFSSNALTFNYLATNLNVNSPIPVYGFDVTSGVETRSIKAGIGYERHLANGRGTLHIYNRSSDDTSNFSGTRSSAGDIKISIDNSGNVGIGITVPTSLLDVNGIAAMHYEEGQNQYSFRGANRAINDWDYSGLTINPTYNDYGDGSWYIDAGTSNTWDIGILSKRRFRRVEGLTLEYETFTQANVGSVYTMIGFVGGTSASPNYNQTPANLTYQDDAGLSVYTNGSASGTDYNVDTRNAWWRFKTVLKGAGAFHYIYRNSKWNLIKETSTNNQNDYEYVRVLFSLHRQRVYIRDLKVYVAQQSYRGANYIDNVVGNLSVAGYLNAGGQTVNGESFYQWEGATYRNPADHTPRLLLRKDNSSTEINGFAPALALYNNNGGDQTTVGMVFVSAEAVSPTQGNAVNLAGIIAKKESIGTAGGWSKGSLNFFVKDHGTKVDALTIQYTGKVGIGTTNPAALLQIGTGLPTTVVTGGIQFGDDNAARIYRITSSTIRVSNNLTVGGTITGDLTGNVTGNVTGSSGSAGYLTGGDSAFYAILYNTTSADLNTFNTAGLHSAEYTGSTNNPTGSVANGHFIQISDAGGTDVKTQWYYNSAGSDIYMRLMWGNGTWRSWRKLLHDGNYTSYPDATKLPLAGGTTSGMVSAYTTFSGNDDWQNSPISIRERALVNNAQSANTYAPNLNFHWGGRASKSLWLDASGILNFGEYDSSGNPAYDGYFRTDTIHAASKIGVGIASPTAKLNVLSSTSLSSVFKAEGVNGTLFEVTDDLSNSLMSVNTIGGLPVFEVFANNSIVAGQYGQNDFVISGNKVGIGTASPSSKLHIYENVNRVTYIAQNNLHTARFEAYGAATAIDTTASNGIFFRINGGDIVKFAADGNVGIGSATPAYKLDVNGTSAFRDTVNIGPNIGTITWGNFGGGTGFGVRAESGRVLSFGAGGSFDHLVINTAGRVGIGITSPSVKLAVDGEASFGDGSKLTMIGLDINSGVTPNFIKIRTKIPFTSGAADFTINIKGFRYGSAETANISICWHYYNSTFYNPAISSAGSFAPIVKLSAEDWDSSGTPKVCIVLVGPGYWPKLYVESMYSSSYNDDYADGWDWIDADATGTGNNLATLSYKSNFGNNFVMLGNGNVGIGTAGPTTKLDIASTQANGIVMRFDTTTNYQAWIRPYWNSSIDSRIDFAINRTSGVTPDVIMSVGYGGYVGIGTTTPATLLQIGTGTPIAATLGVQFGGDTAARIYRVSPSTIQISNNLTVGGTLTESSSIRYKENIQTVSAPILPKLNEIRPVTYNKKDNPNNIEYGIIAEELNDLFPELVNKNNNGEVESVNYSRLTVILIKAVKELQEEVEKLKNK